MNSEILPQNEGNGTLSCGHSEVRDENGERVPARPSSSAPSTTSSSCTSCQLCGYESGRISNLRRHMKTMHEVTSLSFQCCETSFQDKAEYRDHCRQTHRNGHECSICKRSFSRRALLRRHESVHTGYKEFPCTLCPYASSHKSNLERHLKIHGSRKKVGVKSRKIRNPPHPQPDSTTSSCTKRPSSSSYPILLHMLKPNPPETSSVNSKVKLSHSIESILSRKEVRKDPLLLSLPSLPQPSAEDRIKSEFPSRIPERTPGFRVMSPSPLSLSSGIAINHSLSSPFSLGSLRPDYREDGRSVPWRSPYWDYYPETRISSTPNSTEPVISWGSFLMMPPHLLTNYSYPH